MNGFIRFPLLLIVALCFGLRPVIAQHESAIFRPLLADLREPGFFATYLAARTPHLAPRIGSVGFGQTVWLLAGSDNRWRLAVAAGVFSQFDLASRPNYLMNTDYLVGLPLSVRWRNRVARIRIYHQSSHLGEEFENHAVVRRQILSFEAVEAVLAEEFANWRIYGGGEYLFRRSPANLKPAVLQAGVEYDGLDPFIRLGGLGRGRFVAALDGKSFQDRKWQTGWSVKTGVVFSAEPEGEYRGPSWNVMLTAYRGPTPYGQFRRDNISSVGFGLGVSP